MQIVHSEYMEIVQSLVSTIVSPTSVWSIVARGALWFVIAFVIIASSDKPDPQSSLKSIKSNLGFLVMFLVLSTGLIYMLFGFSTT